MRTLKVQGKGEVSVTPDICKYSMLLTTKNCDYSSAYNVLNIAVDNFRERLVSIGISAEEIKTSDYSITAVTAYLREEGKYIPDGYQGTHRLSIKVPLDKERMNTVFNVLAYGKGLDPSCKTSISISFGISDPEAVKKQLLRNAVAVAKTNAETIADAAGIKLGQIASIEYGWSEVRFYNELDYEANSCCEGPAPCPPDIQPNDMSTTDTVTVIYEIL